MANPVFKCFCEILAHFQCGACEKWWSIGDAPVRDHWFCPWCGVRNAAVDDSTDCDEYGVLFWDVPKGVLPEWVKYIAMDKPGVCVCHDWYWYGYEYRPRQYHGQFKVDAGYFVRISDRHKKELILPDIADDQWRNSLRRVRFVECPSPVQGNQSS